MADKKISALTEVTNPATTDMTVVVSSSTTKKCTIANLVIAGANGATFPAFTLGGTVTGGGNTISGATIAAAPGVTLSNTNTALNINTTNTTGGITWQESSVSKAQLVISAGDTYFDYYGVLNLRTGVSGTLRASLTAAGLLTTTTLAVSGIASDAGHTDSTVCQDTATHVFFAGSGTAGICLGTSSARFKESLSDIKEGLAEVLQLVPRNFRYKKGIVDGGKKLQFGFVAEEVEPIMPNVVAKGPQGEINSVDYGALFPILTKAIQELNEKVEAIAELFNDRLEARGMSHLPSQN